MKRLSRICVSGIVGLSLVATGVAAAGTDVGNGAVLTGEIEAGGRIVEGGGNSAKFEEYSRERSNGIGEGWFVLENSDRTHYLRGNFDFQDEKDQTYSLGFGRYGRYGVEFDYMEFPHTFSKQSRTNYMRSDRRFMLPGTWNYGDVSGSAADPTNFSGETLRFRQINGGASAYVRPVLGLEFSAGYHIQDKRGDHPFSVSNAGFGSFSNYASPINESIHTIEGSGKIARDNWTFELAYLGSIFDNDLRSEIIADPGQQTDADGRGALSRISAAPDNQAHQISVAGSYLIPTDFPSRVASTFAYGHRTQNDSFLPYTINTALAPGALPQNDLDGKVHTYLWNLSYTARPTSKWNVDARYRIYALENDSDEIRFTERVPYDNTVSATDIKSSANDYTRQNFDVETSYRVHPMATVSAGFSWENWDRSKDREVRHSNEYEGEFGLRLRPCADLNMLTVARIGYRDHNNYFNLEPGVELDQLRKYDVADRRREEVDTRWTYTPIDELMFAFSSGFSNSDYDDSDFGLVNDRRWNIGVDVEYTPIERLSMSAWYSFDAIETRQRSMNRSGAAEEPSAAPERIWRSKTKDKAHTFGVDFFAIIVVNVIDLRAGYTLQLAEAQTHDKGGSLSAANAANFPDISDDLHSVHTELTWHVIEPLDVIAGYRYEDFRGDNFRYKFGSPGTTIGDNDLYLNNNVRDYQAHIATLTAVYKF